MADDDLDAFFDQVSAAEANAEEETPDNLPQQEEEQEIKPPPAKKLKRPMGVVVAAAASASKAVVIPPPPPPTIQDEEVKLFTIPPPPPPPPPPVMPPPMPHPPVDSNAVTKNAHVRSAAGKVWKDSSLADWPENDYRLFVGNLSKDVTDQQLFEHFHKYPSLQMVKVIMDNKGVSKGYGFVSLLEPLECARAMREMDQTWLSSRPIQVKRSDWKDRELKTVKKKKQMQQRRRKI